MNKDQLILIGTVVGVHGVKGVLKIASYAESVRSFQEYGDIFYQKDGGAVRRLKIGWIKPHKNAFLMSAEGVAGMDAAEALVGGDLFIDRQFLPAPEEGSYYWADLIGLSVFSTDGSFLGILESVIRTGSNDVYVVRNDDQEVLAPALASVIMSVDLEKGVMRVSLPEGM